MSLSLCFKTSPLHPTEKPDTMKELVGKRFPPPVVKRKAVLFRPLPQHSPKSSEVHYVFSKEPLFLNPPSPPSVNAKVNFSSHSKTKPNIKEGKGEPQSLPPLFFFFLQDQPPPELPRSCPSLPPKNTHLWVLVAASPLDHLTAEVGGWGSPSPRVKSKDIWGVGASK